jgi:DNA-binding LacI/PurR family transcriptional regulator
VNRRKTLGDVARLAGVGKVTVSYVLNGHAEEARISADTQERVLRAARDLDYRPNALARMLLQNRTETIAVVFQYAEYFGATSTFISEALRGVCEGCTATGIDVLMHTKPAPDPVSEANALCDGRVDGALVLRDEGDEALSILLRRGLPVVLFFCRGDDPSIPFVDLDNFAGGNIATEHLISLGHRRIAMVRGASKSIASNHRHSGYRHALEVAGIEYDPELVLQLNGGQSGSQIKDLLAMPDPPTAIFAWSDDDAMKCMLAVSEADLSVPEDVSIIGFDSLPACDHTHPPLTSIRQPIALMARRATEVLSELTSGCPPTELHRIVISPSLDIRGSTATCNKSNPVRSL